MPKRSIHVLGLFWLLQISSYAHAQSETISIPSYLPSIGNQPRGEPWAYDLIRPIDLDHLQPIESLQNSSRLEPNSILEKNQSSDWSVVVGLGSNAVDRKDKIKEKLWRDQTNFYSPDSIIFVTTAFGVGALFANTNLDNTIQKHAHSSLVNASTDEWYEILHANKELGDGRYTLPVFAIAATMQIFTDEDSFARPIGLWGEKSLRSFVVGAGPTLILQRIVGGSRPNEHGVHSSHWRPFDDNNGVSGHAFMGSLPFITGAKMTEDVLLKMTLYGGSLLAPLSRVNDGAHYSSQVFLGWALAFAAATAVDTTDDPTNAWRLIPISDGTWTGMAVERRW